MTTTDPVTTDTLELVELRRHVHGTQCWWNHLEARWTCPETATS